MHERGEPVNDPLLAAVVAEPSSDAARRVWADREGGDRGELVHLQCLLAGRGLARRDRWKLARRERELLEHHGLEWAGLGDLGTGRFARGFVEHVSIELATLETRAAELFARAPLVRSLEIRGVGGTIELRSAADDEWLRRAARLFHAFDPLPPGRVTSLSASVDFFFSRQQWPGPYSVSYGTAFAQLVASAPSLAGLEELSGGTLDHDAIPALVRLPALRRLGCSPQLGGAALAVLLGSPHLARLRALELPGNGLTDDDLGRIAETPSLADLERLGLGSAMAGPRGLEAITRSPHLANLVELDMEGFGTWSVAAPLVAAASFAPRLRRLSLRRHPPLDSGDVAALLRLPALEHLEIDLDDLRPELRERLVAESGRSHLNRGGSK